MKCNKTHIFSELLYICKLFHMNEIEIIQWIIGIESTIIDWDKYVEQQTVLFLITAFQAKVMISNNLGIF